MLFIKSIIYFQFMKKKNFREFNCLSKEEVENERIKIRKSGQIMVKQMIEALQKSYNFRENQFIKYDRKGNASLMSKEEITTFHLISLQLQKVHRAAYRKEIQILEEAYVRINQKYSQQINKLLQPNPKKSICSTDDQKRQTYSFAKPIKTITKRTRVAATNTQQKFSQEKLAKQLEDMKRKIEKLQFQNNRISKENSNLQRFLSKINRQLQEKLKQHTLYHHEKQDKFLRLPITQILQENVDKMIKFKDDLVKKQKDLKLQIQQLTAQKQLVQSMFNKKKEELQKERDHSELLKRQLENLQEQLQERNGYSYSQSIKVKYSKQLTFESSFNQIKTVKKNHRSKSSHLILEEVDLQQSV